MEQAFVGIDVQERRECCFAVINGEGNLLESGWLRDSEQEIIRLARRLQNKYEIMVGIDAPRKPLLSPRKWFWDGKRGKWRLGSGQLGHGRHCEIVIQVHRLAIPQFTPWKEKAPPWMVIGFNIFSALNDVVPLIHEVFPTASYSLLQKNTDVQISIDFSNFRFGPKDMLDALVAAATVREFGQGRGIEVGGGDGLGTIVLPRPLPPPVIQGVLQWPKERNGK